MRDTREPDSERWRDGRSSGRDGGNARTEPRASNSCGLTMEASLARRRAVLAQRTADEGLDGLVVPGWGLMKRHGHLDWLVGAAPPARPAWAILSPGGELTVIVTGEADADYLGHASGAHVRVAAGEPGFAREAARLIRRAGLVHGRVGVVGRDSLMSAAALAELRNALGGASLAEARPMADAAKARKDEYELSRLREAAGLAAAAFERAAGAVEPRTSFAAIAAEAYAEAFAGGARDVIVFAGAGLYHGFPAPADPIEPGALVTLYVELADRAGYWVEQIGMVAVGDLDSSRASLARAVLAALSAGEQLLEPGNSQGAPADTMRQVAASAGYGAGLNHSLGHGVGTGDEDPPRIAVGEQAPLMSGMVLVLHPNLFDRAAAVSAAAGGAYVITDHGVERLGTNAALRRT